MASTTQLPILTLSLARHLAGHDISEVIDKAWQNPEVSEATRSHFENVGFNLDVNNPESNLRELDGVLQQKKWAGILVGWCTRGHVEFTEFFELVIAHCVEYIGEEGLQGPIPKTKLMFSRGPDDLVNTTLRNFPVEQ